MNDIKKAPFRADIRIPEEIKNRLEERAQIENRSRNAQATHYIEMGLDGLDARQMAQSIADIDAKLTEILRYLGRDRPKR